MMTLRQFKSKPETIPAATSWYLADLGEARGKQELFTRQSPQRLKVLRENAMIESVVSSNRIEGVTVNQARVRTVIFGKSPSRDRDEEEVRGYRDALKLIHEGGAKLPVSEETLLDLHRMCRGEIWDAGKYKDKDSDIIEKYPDGRERVRFKTVRATKTPSFTKELIEKWQQCLEERWVHPLIAMAAFNLDFLCVHPFRDGNGRVSRLLLLLQCYHLGYEVGRYISLERLIEQNKERYYETLDQSSRGWHESKHDPWSYVNYVLYTLKTAYREFEERVGQVASPKGAKTELVLKAIKAQKGEFRLVDIERTCPGVGRDWIRVLLADLRKSGEAQCKGKGPAARWIFRGRKRTTLK
ncbi:MAG: cell filamentation protein Fic [Deltaproteobacteria bacterium RBG_13_52_11b]|nr:MAG: cell filamentation protein Fic [Deltaproteobacteria bacterium RBG_13_52_11b]